MLFYKIVNHEVNATSKGILIVANEPRKKQEHNKLMSIRANIYDYKYS